MRYGIIADIHGNLEALEAVLEGLSGEKPDRILCAGDIVGYGADPSECIKRTKGLGPLAVIGNHDAACAGTLNTRQFNEVAREAVLWTRKRLTANETDFLKNMELVYRNRDLTMVHGTLNEPEMFHYMFDKHMASATLSLMKTRVCFIGHSHVPGIFSRSNNTVRYFYEESVRLAKDEHTIVNVGSVGQPRDGDPRACYCIYDTDKRKVEIKRVRYDVEKAQRKILGSGLPSFLAHRLTEGM